MSIEEVENSVTSIRNKVNKIDEMSTIHKIEIGKSQSGVLDKLKRTLRLQKLVSCWKREL